MNLNAVASIFPLLLGQKLPSEQSNFLNDIYFGTSLAWKALLLGIIPTIPPIGAIHGNLPISLTDFRIEWRPSGAILDLATNAYPPMYQMHLDPNGPLPPLPQYTDVPYTPPIAGESLYLMPHRLRFRFDMSQYFTPDIMPNPSAIGHVTQGVYVEVQLSRPENFPTDNMLEWTAVQEAHNELISYLLHLLAVGGYSNLNPLQPIPPWRDTYQILLQKTDAALEPAWTNRDISLVLRTPSWTNTTRIPLSEEAILRQTALKRYLPQFLDSVQLNSQGNLQADSTGFLMQTHGFLAEDYLESSQPQIDKVLTHYGPINNLFNSTELYRYYELNDLFHAQAFPLRYIDAYGAILARHWIHFLSKTYQQGIFYAETTPIARMLERIKKFAKDHWYNAEVLDDPFMLQQTIENVVGKETYQLFLLMNSITM